MKLCNDWWPTQVEFFFCIVEHNESVQQQQPEQKYNKKKERKKLNQQVHYKQYYGVNVLQHIPANTSIYRRDRSKRIVSIMYLKGIMPSGIANRGTLLIYIKTTIRLRY